MLHMRNNQDSPSWTQSLYNMDHGLWNMDYKFITLHMAVKSILLCVNYFSTYLPTVLSIHVN